MLSSFPVARAWPTFLVLMALLLAGIGLAPASNAVPPDHAKGASSEGGEKCHPKKGCPEPTEEPTAEPTAEPTTQPTEEPTVEPTVEPTEEPTTEPTEEPGPGRALVVTEQATLTTAEQELVDGLTARGWSVGLSTQGGVTTAEADGYDVAAISSTVYSGAIGGSLNGTTAGVVTWEDGLYDDLGIAAGQTGQLMTDSLDVDGTLVTTLTKEQSLVWATPVASAQVDARLPNGGPAMFSVESGATLADGASAAGRRVAFPMTDPGPNLLTTEGWNRLDQALIWAAGGDLATEPTPEPTTEPSPEPTTEPTTGPTEEPSPEPSPEPTSDTSYAVDVRVAAGQNIQKVVDSYPAGSTFLLGAGVHRLQSVVARRGDTFVGEDGAVLSGARVLSAGAVSWQSSGGDWFVGGQTQQGFVHGDIDAGGNALHARPEELFVGGVRWEPVGSRAQLGDGRWFFDYANDRIWLGVDPAGLGLIETSAAVGAFGGDQVKDVTIANLTIEKYATPGQHGAIGFFGEHWTHDWTVRDVVVRDNHGAGIRIGPGMTIDGCRVSNNGQIGIAGSGTDKETGYATPIVVRNCEIDHNLQLDYRFSWEGGATKFKYTVGSLIENNWVHDNHGLGLWFDVDNYNAVIRSNLVENNDVRGIMYEISYGNTEIYWNTVRNNGHAAPSEHQAMGILVSNSENVRVYENVVYGSPRGIAIRADANRSPAVRNVVVANNDVVQGDGWSGMFLKNGTSTNAYTSWGNKFTGNTWRLDDLGQRRFMWHDDSIHTAAQWQDYGQDTNGTFVQSSKPGALPSHATAYNPHTVGP